MPRQVKRCAIYTRRSATDADPVVRSSLIQYQKCLRLIEARDWIPIPELFDDDGWSGANGERPALERLLDRIEQRTFDQLVVYRVDRLTRSFSDWVKLGQILKRFGVGLSVADGNLDADGSALTMLQLNTLAIFAELERDMITERLRDGHASRRARGLRTSGAIPFGYRADRRTNQLVPVPAEADVVRWMFELARAGALPAQIAREANAAHAERRWTARSVLRLLRNPTYVGQLPDCTPAMHTAIVDAELFESVVRQIAARRTREPSSREPLDASEDPFLLRGLLVCAECGGRMTTSTNAKVKAVRAILSARDCEQPRYYRCRGRDCSGTQLRAAHVEAAVERLLKRPPTSLPPAARAKLARLGATWDLMWRRTRRVVLEDTFESIAWSAKRRRLVPRFKADAISVAPGRLLSVEEDDGET